MLVVVSSVLKKYVDAVTYTKYFQTLQGLEKEHIKALLLVEITCNNGSISKKKNIVLLWL
jgi:hypothetical protein